jgi:hypothetical protein
MNAGRVREVAATTVLLGAALLFFMAPAGSQQAGGRAPDTAAPVSGTSGAAAPGAAVPGGGAPAFLTAPAGSPAPADDIRDIRGPKPVASPWVLWSLIGGGVLAALLGYGLWRWMKQRRSEPLKTDFEVALARLEAARALMQPGRAREFSIEVSAIVREYIERRFKVMAAHRTTHEFLHDLVLSANPGLAAHRDLLGEFLQSCDLAKFGGWDLQIDQMNIMLESASRFIHSVSTGDAGARYAGSSTKDAAPAGPGVPTESDKSRVSLPST